jgi:hypothetical protein
LEALGGENALHHTRKIAAVSEVGQPGKSRTINWHEFTAILGGHGELPLQVVFNLHFHQTFLCLLASGQIDSPMSKVIGKFWICPFLVTFVTVDVSRPFSRDRSKFDSNSVGCGISVGKCMGVSLCSSKLAAPTSGITAF